MAPRRSTKRKRSKASAYRRKKTQHRSSSRTHTTAGLRALLIRGTNVLKAVTVDSAVSQSVADLVFRDLGVTKVALSKRTFYNVETSVYGVGCAFGIPLSAIIKNAPQLPKVAAGASSYLLTNFNSGCLKHLRITLAPSGPVHNRRGHWAMAFIPFTTTESRGYYERNTSIPTLQDVMLVPGAAFGLATEELSVNFRAKTMDFCCLSHPLNTVIGLVLISFNGMSRDVSKLTIVEGFGASITVSGIVKIVNPIPHVGSRSITCSVTDYIKQKLIRVNNFDVTKGKCEVKDGKLYVTGAFAPIQNAHNGVPSAEDVPAAEEEGQLDGIATSNGDRKG